MSKRNNMRLLRHARLRKTLSGTPDRPRLSVFRSLKNLYVQIIDDEQGRTLVSVSTNEKSLREQFKACNIATATSVGKLIAERAKAAGISKVVFDRGGHAYHGKVKAIADAARAEGLVF